MADVVYVDLAEGVKRMMNKIPLYVKFLTQFKDNTKLDDLEAAFAANDAEAARGAAHTIKGLAANLALAELFKQCLELETQMKAGTMNPDQMEIVRTVFAATLQEIDKVIAEHA